MTVVTISGPNGSDDAAQFNAALATIKAAGIGGTIRVDANAGPYQIQTPIIWDSLDGVTLCSAGTRATLNLSSTGKLNVTNATNCTVRDLVFNCVSGWSANASLFAQAATHFTVRGCAFVGGGHQVCIIGVHQSVIASSTFTGLTVAGNCVFAVECNDLLLEDLQASQISYPASSGAPRVIQASLGNNLQILGGSIQTVDMHLVAAGAGLALSGVTQGIVQGFTVNGLEGAPAFITETAFDGSVQRRTSKIIFAGCTATNNGANYGSILHGGFGFRVIDGDSVSLVDCNASYNGGHAGNPGVHIRTCQKVSLVRCSSSYSGGYGILVESSPDLTLDDVQSTWNGSSGLYVLRASGTVAESQRLRVVRGFYSYNGTPPNSNSLSGQGMYLANVTDATILDMKAKSIFVVPNPPQEHGILNASTAHSYGLGVDLRFNNSSPYYDSTGTLLITQSQT